MCGIFGIIERDSSIDPQHIQDSVRRLLLLSESRGREASGLAISSPKEIGVLKRPYPASTLIKQREFSHFFRDHISAFSSNGSTSKSAEGLSYALIGHSRLVTNGAQAVHENNQPVIASNTVGIHNGIIVNDETLWSEHPELSKSSEVDSEVLLALIEKHYQEGNSLEEATRRTFQEIQGAASIATLFREFNVVLLATNNGSLYAAIDPNSTRIVFASEESILKNFLRSKEGRRLYEAFPTIRRVQPGEGCLIDLDSPHHYFFSIDPKKLPPEQHRLHQSPAQFEIERSANGRTIRDLFNGAQENTRKSPPSTPQRGVLPPVPQSFEQHVEERATAVQKLRRCTRCVLPETMPFITFNTSGVCSYCENYQKIQLKGEEALGKYVATFRKNNGEPDCCIALSGGRDSTYGLHYAKEVLGLNPIAYTYDWGMVTDLARRNISRICGQLGVEHILVSADIKWKRENIRKNVSAWLNKPDLGMIPLFMAGDKHFYYHANRLAKETGVEKIVFCENLLETTSFKTGFTGIPPLFGTENTITLRSLDKLKLAGYYGKRFLTNPGYWNSSLIDTFAAYCSYYVIPHDYFFLFQYIEWEENEIMGVLNNTYDWEVASDTTSTWRIGDGTASFYNYIYFNVAGFTENDTFRSNQIREGQISREEGIEFITRENLPRWDTIREYCALIGVDFEHAIRRINEMKPLFCAA
ncbi:hypothetical protein MRY87_06090 [bacterium]|nr:hypothetical protein [bacterium]